MPNSTSIGCFLALLLSGCTALIDGPPGSSASGSVAPGSLAPPGSPGSGTPAAGEGPATPAGDFALAAGAGARARLWRLTEVQYRNAIKDLLNVTLTTEMPPDDGGDFGNRADLLDVSPGLLEAYADAAEAAANQLIPARLGELLTCQPLDAASAACVEPFIRSFGARAFRRPLEADEVASLLRLHADLTLQLDGNAGVSAV